MSVLGGEFAVILLLSGKEEHVEALIRELPGQGEALGLRITLRKTAAPRPAADSRPYLLESVSLDTPGIVHSVTSLLRRHGVSIDDLETDTTPAPWTGAPMFVMRARLTLPAEVSVASLREELDRLESEQNLDIKFAPVSPLPGEL